jgi:SAM-dependent MidA family methyltransferase
MLSHLRSWRDAWADSAYGRDGFWHAERAGDHFRTAVASSPLIADMVGRILKRYHAITTVIDIGAGGGQLLDDLAGRCRDLRLIGVDAAPRPAELPAEVSWYADVWDVRTGSWTTGGVEAAYAAVFGPALMVMSEWLDDLPCTVAVRRAAWGEDHPRELLVAPDGTEHPGPELGADEQSWARRWWPTGSRIEVGLSRDRAWASALRSLPRGGLGLMIDYGHLVARRPPAGSLAAYRAGRRVSPSPSSTTNLTAHVAVDAVQAAGTAVGAQTLMLRRQAQVLLEAGENEHGDQAGGEPTALDLLVRRSQLRALSDPAGWGAHWWLLQSLPRMAVVD